MNIEICVPPSSTPKDRGDLLEILSKEMLEIQNYHVEEEVRKDGSELDLLCTHNISKKRIYVECKAFRDKKAPCRQLKKQTQMQTSTASTSTAISMNFKSKLPFQLA